MPSTTTAAEKVALRHHDEATLGSGGTDAIALQGAAAQRRSHLVTSSLMVCEGGNRGSMMLIYVAPCRTTLQHLPQSLPDLSSCTAQAHSAERMAWGVMARVENVYFLGSRFDTGCIEEAVRKFSLRRGDASSMCMWLHRTCITWSNYMRTLPPCSLISSEHGGCFVTAAC